MMENYHETNGQGEETQQQQQPAISTAIKRAKKVLQAWIRVKELLTVPEGRGREGTIDLQENASVHSWYTKQGVLGEDASTPLCGGSGGGAAADGGVDERDDVSELLQMVGSETTSHETKAQTMAWVMMRQNVTLAYAVHSMAFVYMRCTGVMPPLVSDTTPHAVRVELDRLRRYFGVLERCSPKGGGGALGIIHRKREGGGPSTVLNVPAAKRVLSAAVLGPR